VRWSVSVVAEGDRVLTHNEIVELADAVAPLDGIASGIGAMAYGAQLVVRADSSDEAVELAMEEFTKAAARAGLPAWPITRAETIGEDDDPDNELDDIG
jgi:hypothetical protein